MITPADTRTRSTSRPRRACYAVDTGFIVFNDRNYPNFERLLDELEVRDASPPTMSFGGQRRR